MDTAFNILVTGLVQGVGFRPFIFLLAARTGVKGWVRNTNQGVEIFVQGAKANVSEFIRKIRPDAPGASDIEEVYIFPAAVEDWLSFTIRRSDDRSEDVTGVSPDIAVCPDCLEDMETQPHRLMYPFVNCTNCGPRFSIIRDLPYDRRKTSMEPFAMCDICRSEYEDINDRRFHAQPVACDQCGPAYELLIGKQKINGDAGSILTAMNDLLSSGKIIAIKGTGGYHLACNAFNEKAVRELRQRKHRDGKPFALLFRDIDALKVYAKINKQEEEALLSWRRPIVILRMKDREKHDPLFRDLNSGLSNIGAFLPYMPVHYLLFRYFKGPALVMTSGNISTEPIVSDDAEALQKFDSVADAFLVYNREIVNRTDDSVVRVIGNTERLIRRSRGYVPAPVKLACDVDNIVAFGGELSAVFCVGRGNRAIPGQYIGDMQSMATNEFFRSAMKDLIGLFRVSPSLIACDLHPGYFSTKLAETYDSLPVVRVQHHHAHIASCMAEHGLDEKVIGVAFDGTGYGSDGKTWGAEFLVCDLLDFRRILHFDYIPLPGGDKAVEEPWRTAVAYLSRAFGSDFMDLPLPFLGRIDRKRMRSVRNMLENKINCPEVSSAGRLFDAVAAIMDICLGSTFQAEAPMRMEALVSEGCRDEYTYKTGNTVRVEAVIREIVADIIKGTGNEVISTKFHNTIISIIFDSVSKISAKEKIARVVLSGGVFQNRYILEKAENLLRSAGFQVFSNEKVPSNDGGIALGQIVIAAKRRSMGCV